MKHIERIEPLTILAHLVYNSVDHFVYQHPQNREAISNYLMQRRSVLVKLKFVASSQSK